MREIRYYGALVVNLEGNMDKEKKSVEDLLKEYEKQANNSQMFSANDSFCEGCCKDLCCLAMCNCCLDSLCNRY